MHAGRQGILQWSEEADGVPRNLLIPRTHAGIKESLWNSTEPGGCAWSQADIRGRKRAVRASRRIPRIQMEVVESGSSRAYVGTASDTRLDRDAETRNLRVVGPGFGLGDKHRSGRRIDTK